MVCLLYSAGIPMLWFVAAMVCLGTYAMDKLMLLRLARLPPQFDQSLAHMFLGLIPLGIIAHCFWGIWMFSAAFWPRPPLGNSGEVLKRFEAERFPCANMLSEGTCMETAGCLWSEEACSINTASREYREHRSLSYFERLFNGVTIIYTLVSFYLVLRQLLLFLPMTKPAMQRVESLIWIGVLAIADGVRGKLLPLKQNRIVPTDEPEAVGPAEEEGDAEVGYRAAVENKMFGNSPIDYDIRTIGDYAEVLNYGNNMQQWKMLVPEDWKHEWLRRVPVASTPRPANPSGGAEGKTG